jgi:hypothetical protein
MRKLLVLVVLVAVFVGVLYVAGGRMAGPSVTIVTPERFVGASTALNVQVRAPGGLSSLRIDFEQDGTRTAIIGPDDAAPEADASGTVTVDTAIGKDTVPGLHSGAGRLVIVAARSVLRGLRTVETEITRDLVVRLEPPRVSVLSTRHYINQGGAEMVLYRVPPDADASVHIDSGVDVGGIEYPGYPASGVKIEGVVLNDPALHVAFFALLHDQPVDVPMVVYARDEAGNATTVPLEHRAFPKVFKRSRINLDD